MTEENKKPEAQKPVKPSVPAGMSPMPEELLKPYTLFVVADGEVSLHERLAEAELITAIKTEYLAQFTNSFDSVKAYVITGTVEEVAVPKLTTRLSLGGKEVVV